MHCNLLEIYNCPNLSQQKTTESLIILTDDTMNIIHLIHKIQATLQNERTHSFCLPTLKATAARSDREKAMGRWNLSRFPSSPLITGFGRDMVGHNTGGREDKEDKPSWLITLTYKYIFLYF